MPYMNVQVFVPVTEDWYGNYRIESDARYKNTLLVAVSLLELHDHTWRVCVWGNDDHGLEKDLTHEQFDQALTLFQQIVSEPYPTHAWLMSLGLYAA